MLKTGIGSFLGTVVVMLDILVGPRRVIVGGRLRDILVCLRSAIIVTLGGLMSRRCAIVGIRSGLVGWRSAIVVMRDVDVGPRSTIVVTTGQLVSRRCATVVLLERLVIGVSAMVCGWLLVIVVGWWGGLNS